MIRGGLRTRVCFVSLGGFDTHSNQQYRQARLRHETDFRSVYATILEEWLNCPSEPVPGRRFEPLPILRPAAG
ncbi:MAG: hypothetical protein ACLFTU_05575 [Puniceicoccaceae bacterium]